MYIPAAFAETDLTTLHDFIEQNSFGLFVSQVEGRPFASHLPFLLERETGAQGTLIGHMARANEQWKEASGQNALAIFSGPHAHISPIWYDEKEVVPTWNYVAVHVYGRVQVIDDPDRTRKIVEAMVEVYEQTMPQPWSFDPSDRFAARMLAQIVGFRIEIDAIEGKWKLNQNQPVERRRKVVRALQARGGENALKIAGMIQSKLPAEY